MKTVVRFLTMALIQSFSLQALARDVSCHTPSQAQKITLKVGVQTAQISRPTIEIYNFKSNAKTQYQIAPGVDEFNQERALSSLTELNSGLNTTGGMVKTFAQNGLEYTVFIRNLSNLSEVDDYMSIRNAKGHVVSYPLICH